MLYLDYQRPDGEWRANMAGGNYNLEAIDFLRNINGYILSTYKGTMMIAEESTAFPMVTLPPEVGGLGFSYKWNMGWMNDNLEYLDTDPIYRKQAHNKMTFSITYAFSENYVLPLSHDEVVHGKRSLIGRSQGNYEDKFANLKTFLGFYMAHPGKKLSFMGNEFAQFIEWDYKKGLDWFLLDYDTHKKMQEFVKELNHLYKKEKAFYQKDFDWSGFEWIVVEDRDQSVFAITRSSESGRKIICIANFTPVDRYDYKIGVDKKGRYKTLLTSSDSRFGGRGVVQKEFTTQNNGMHGKKQSISINLEGNSVTFIALTR
jgi:1,4-alpha-glucan branching enzyme